MRSLTIELSDNTIAIVYPVPRSKLGTFDLLRQRLFELWLEYQQDTAALIKPWIFQRRKGRKKGKVERIVSNDRAWFLIRSLAKLIPSDKVAPLNIDQLRQHPKQIERLFIIDGEQAGELIRLHIYEPVERKKKASEDGAPTIHDISFPTTGDADADTLGNLLTLWTPSEVHEFWSRYDAETIDKTLSVYSELSRPSDERLQEFIRGRDEKLLAANKEILAKALGLPSYYDFDD